jgi:outer membrane immunogenic protein
MSLKFGIAPLLAASVAFPAVTQAQPVSIPAKDFGPVWTGFYVGGAFGAGGTVNHTDTNTGAVGVGFNGSGGSGVLGSIYGGVDYQIAPRAVIGVLAEATLSSVSSSASASLPGLNASVTSQPNFSWAVLARAGMLANSSTLLYLVGGYTGQNVRSWGTASAGGATASFSREDAFHGWTFGPGFESMLGGGWSTKLEYRYSQYGRQQVGSNIYSQPSTHAVRAGLSYKFGGLGVGASEGRSFNEPATNWTGIYAGVAAGAGMSFSPTTATAGAASATFDTGGQGLLGGVFVGADYQFARQALAGIMGDFSWTGMQGTSTFTTAGGSAYTAISPNREWSVMARLGWLPTPSTLLYGAVGYTGMNVKSTATAVLAGGNTLFGERDTTVNGWAVAPGIETVITGGWTTRLEYRYSQYEQKEVVAGVTTQPSTHTIRLGIAYKLGLGGNKSVAEAE